MDYIGILFGVMCLVTKPRKQTKEANPTVKVVTTKANVAKPRSAKDGFLAGKKGASSVTVEFRRDLTLFSAVMIGIGAMIGAGIFVLSGIAAGLAGPALIVAFFLNGLLVIADSMTYAELGSAFPEAGGGYLWVKKGLPPPMGFVSGWISWFGHTVACSLYALGFGTYMAWLLNEYHFNPIPTGFFIGSDKIFAIIVAIILLYINYRGTASTGKSEGFFTMAKLTTLGIFIALGIVAMAHNPRAMDNLFSDFVPEGGSGILFAMALTIIAFQGYEVVAQTGEEIQNPKKNIPRAIFISLIIVVSFYLIIATVLFGIVTQDMMNNAGVTQPYQLLKLAGEGGETALLVIAHDALGPLGVGVIVIGGLMSTLSALNATIFSSSRVAFAMGRDGALPKDLGTIHPTRRTPHKAIRISGIIMIFMIAFFPIQTVAGSADMMFLVLFAMTNAAGISLRYKMPELDRGFKIPFFPVLPILAIVLDLCMIYPLYLIEPLSVYLGVIWILVGAYVYLFTGAKKEIVETPIEVNEMPSTISKELAQRYRVLIPVGNMEETRMIDLGISIAKARDGDLSLLNIVEVPMNTPTTAVGYKDVHEQIKRMEELEKYAKKSDLRVDARLLLSHEVADTIIEAAATEHVNMLLIGWYGRKRRGFVMGTNIDQIVGQAKADVIVLKWAGLSEDIKEIMLLYGEGHHVVHAAQYASILAQKHGAVVNILYISQSSEPSVKEKKHLDRLKKIFEANNVPVYLKTMKDMSLIDGIVRSTITTDLLFIGAEENLTLGHNLFGNMSDRIAIAVKCPTAIVKSFKSDDNHRND
jgi:basic amino acid/polyamine antiporter, APA family